MELSSDISAIVTGGASGLGEATARGFAAKGVKVGIFDMNEERGKAVAAEIGGAFARVTWNGQCAQKCGLMNCALKD